MLDESVNIFQVYLVNIQCGNTFVDIENEISRKVHHEDVFARLNVNRTINTINIIIAAIPALLLSELIYKAELLALSNGLRNSPAR